MSTRRQFLIGLFGTAAVVAAGTIPKAIEALIEKDFEVAVKAVMPTEAAEIYGNGKDYAFATIKYLNEAPWFEITIPEGFRPLRAESDRINKEVLTRMGVG